MPRELKLTGEYFVQYLSRVLPNFNACFCNSIYRNTEKIFLIFLLENSSTKKKKGKQLYFDHHKYKFSSLSTSLRQQFVLVFFWKTRF